MTSKEAANIFEQKIPGKKILSCTEYSSMFVFNTSDNFDGLIAIRKSDGMIKNFQPTDIPIEEYKAGKEVKID